MNSSPTSAEGVESELYEVYPDIPLGQGDVIIRRIQGGDVFERVGVVVTADCHLAHKKHRGHLNFVPVLPSSTYLAVTWIDDHLQERRLLAEGELHRVMRDAHSAVLGHISNLTPDRAASWAREAGSDEIQSALRLPAVSPDGDRIAVLADLLKQLDQLSYASFEAARDLLFLFCDARLGKNFRNTAESLSKRLLQLPDDAFFLNGGSELTDPSGYVCYLRLLQRVDESEISLTNNPLLDRGERQYRRIGRVRSPFVYALTQSLGYMYSTIGLPTTYEGLRNEAVTALRARLEGEK